KTQRGRNLGKSTRDSVAIAKRRVSEMVRDKWHSRESSLSAVTQQPDDENARETHFAPPSGKAQDGSIYDNVVGPPPAAGNQQPQDQVFDVYENVPRRQSAHKQKAPMLPRAQQEDTTYENLPTRHSKRKAASSKPETPSPTPKAACPASTQLEVADNVETDDLYESVIEMDAISIDTNSTSAASELPSIGNGSATPSPTPTCAGSRTSLQEPTAPDAEAQPAQEEQIFCSDGLTPPQESHVTDQSVDLPLKESSSIPSGLSPTQGLTVQPKESSSSPGVRTSPKLSTALEKVLGLLPKMSHSSPDETTAPDEAAKPPAKKSSSGQAGRTSPKLSAALDKVLGLLPKGRSLSPGSHIPPEGSTAQDEVPQLPPKGSSPSPEGRTSPKLSAVMDKILHALPKGRSLSPDSHVLVEGMTVQDEGVQSVPQGRTSPKLSAVMDKILHALPKGRSLSPDSHVLVEGMTAQDEGVQSVPQGRTSPKLSAVMDKILHALPKGRSLSPDSRVPAEGITVQDEGAQSLPKGSSDTPQGRTSPKFQACLNKVLQAMSNGLAASESGQNPTSPEQNLHSQTARLGSKTSPQTAESTPVRVASSPGSVTSPPRLRSPGRVPEPLTKGSVFETSPIRQRSPRGQIVQQAVATFEAKTERAARSSTSPVRKVETRSPVRKSDTTSPVRKSDTTSPVRKSDITSPVRKSDTTSPVRRSDTTSAGRKLASKPTGKEAFSSDHSATPPRSRSRTPSPVESLTGRTPKSSSRVPTAKPRAAVSTTDETGVKAPQVSPRSVSASSSPAPILPGSDRSTITPPRTTSRRGRPLSADSGNKSRSLSIEAKKSCPAPWNPSTVVPPQRSRRTEPPPRAGTRKGSTSPVPAPPPRKRSAKDSLELFDQTSFHAKNL
ncbi:hypothetical protein BaRGS_00022829, partial [Batillaria attramentaria]